MNIFVRYIDGLISLLGNERLVFQRLSLHQFGQRVAEQIWVGGSEVRLFLQFEVDEGDSLFTENGWQEWREALTAAIGRTLVEAHLDDENVTIDLPVGEAVPA